MLYYFGNKCYRTHFLHQTDNKHKHQIVISKFAIDLLPHLRDPLYNPLSKKIDRLLIRMLTEISLTDLMSDNLHQHCISIAYHFKHTHVDLHRLEQWVEMLLVEFLQNLQLIRYKFVVLYRYLVDIDQHLLDWDVAFTAQFQLDLHAFDQHLIHLFVFSVELLLFVVYSVQQILYIRHFR